MSPNEFQLRSALRDGEGDRVDPDVVIARVRDLTQARRDRRVRYGSVAAIVAVVGGIGVVGGITLHGGGQHKAASAAHSSTGKYNAPGQGAAADSAASQPQRSIAPGPLADAAALSCPTAVPHLQTPGGGATNGQFGSGRSLFSGPPEAIKICAYFQQGGAPIPGPNNSPLATVLTGPQATALAASLDAAPKAHPAVPCPLYLSSDGRTLVLIGLTSSGQAMRPITATVAQNPCNLPVTNGTAIRYDWSPPASLDGFVAQARSSGGAGKVSIAPSGNANVTGSPIQS